MQNLERPSRGVLARVILMQRGWKERGRVVVIVPVLMSNNIEEAVACERTILNLQCRPGAIIRIRSAVYGRDDPTTCLVHGRMSSGMERTVTCSSQPAASVVEGKCSGLANCSVPAYTALFGLDPCPGIAKLLRVHDECYDGKLLPTYSLSISPSLYV